MMKLIKEYLKLCIDSKKSLKKEISRLDKVTMNLYDITAKWVIMFDEYKDDSYKTKFHNEHKKRIEAEKEAKEIIQEFTNSLKELEKENKKLKEVNNGKIN